MKFVTLATIVLVCAASSCAQTLPPGVEMPPGMANMFEGLPNLADPKVQAELEACSAYMDANTAGQEACAAAAEASTDGCVAECRDFWRGLPAGCMDLVKGLFSIQDPDGNTVDPKEYFDALCEGEGGGRVVTPSTPDVPGFNVTMEGYSSAFECNATEGFAWITLNASLASVGGGGAGAELALNSTCSDLNTTGCCYQGPADANLTVVQYGLGEPMVVQGVKLSAPQGSCSLAAGDGACAERLVGTWVLVTNSSLQDFEASEEFTSFMQAMNLLNDTGVDALELRDSALWMSFMGAADEGFCNMASPFDFYPEGDPESGSTVNNGTAYIGCGLGVMGGQGSISLTGGLADALGVSGSTGGANDGSAVAVVQPSGSWVMLARYGEDDPLAFCGLQVCAKKAPAPANGTASA